MTLSLSPVRPAVLGSGRYLDTPRGADWRDQAACIGEDPELFFPKFGNPAHAAQIEEAKAICRRCPVVSDCFAAAQARDEDHGVWGGVDFTDKNKATRQQPSHRPLAPVTAIDLAIKHGAPILIAHYLDGASIEALAERWQTTTYAVRDAITYLRPEVSPRSNRPTVRMMRQAGRFRALRASGKSQPAIAMALGIGRTAVKTMAAMVAQIDIYEKARIEREDMPCAA